MNKKLLAAAVAAVFVSPAAFAANTIYGKFHASIDAQDYESEGANGVDNYEVNSRSSRLGFKGSEDLGNGLKAIYQLELSVDVTDGGGVSGTNRNTFIGLSGDWGTVAVGRHDTPMKMAFYAAGTERLGDSVIDLNPGGNNPIGVFNEVRANDVIAYISPNFSGFSFAAAAIPGEESGTSTGNATTPGLANDNDGIADTYSFGLMYKGNGLRVGAGYENLALNEANPDNDLVDDETTWQIGASYTMNNFSIGAHYQDSENKINPVLPGINKDIDYTAWAVTGKYTFGNNALALVYTDAEWEPDSSYGSSVDVEQTGWGVSAEHNFSKRTKVYAAYASGEVEYDSGWNLEDEDNDVFSLGMIHNF